MSGQKIIICSNCNERKTHKAKGLCVTCYNYQWRKENPEKVKAWSEQKRKYMKNYISPSCKAARKRNLKKKIKRNNLIVDIYSSGSDVKETAKKLDLHPTTVRHVLKEMNVPLRQHRKYTLNEKFFNYINSEKKAYWLGFIAADGCVANEYCLQVALAAKDKEYLEKLRDTLGSNAPLKHHDHTIRGKRHSGFMLRIGSMQMIQDLMHLNITPRKNFTLTPSPIPNHLARHYWRGLLDGDGWISLRSYKSQKAQWELGLRGTQEIVTEFRNFIVTHGIQTNAQPRLPQKDNIWRITFCGNGLVPQITKLLYENATIYLERKHKLAIQTIQWQASPQPKTRLDRFPGDPICTRDAPHLNLSNNFQNSLKYILPKYHPIV